MPRKKTIDRATQEALFATEQAILDIVDEMIFPYDLQEQVYDISGQTIEIDNLNQARLFLNMRNHAHLRQDLLATMK